MKQVEQPPVLSDEQIGNIIKEQEIEEGERGIATAQRDDTWQKAQAIYEPLIQQEKIKAMQQRQSWLANVCGWRNPDQINYLIQQAKREIFEEGEKPCNHWLSSKGSRRQKRFCRYCWQSLKSKYLEGKSK